MYQCGFCGSTFRSFTEGGKCRICGGPGLRLVKPDVEVRVQTEYVYLPTPDLYLPRTFYPVRRVRQVTYSALGYKWATFVFLAVAALIIWQVYVAFFTSQTTPTPEVAVPTLVPTRAFVEPTEQFSGVRFFTASESGALRTQENVVHVAVLGGGYGARYMADYAVILDGSWRKVDQVFGITGLTSGETSVTIGVDTGTFVLNKHQGFILASRPGKIYIVDTDGSLWETGFSEQLLVPVAQVQNQLSAPIPVNPRLSLTLK